MANTIAYAEVFQRTLDEYLTAEPVTSWMTENANSVIYNGGNKYKVPKISFGSNKPVDYDKENGFATGSVTLEYEEKTFEKDWGQSFMLDTMDIDESNFVLTAANTMKQFNKTVFVPNIDAYRLQKIEALAAAKSHSRELTPTKANVYSELKSDLRKAVSETGIAEKDMVIHICQDAYTTLCDSTELQKTLQVNGAAADLNANIKTINNATLIVTPNSRMMTADNKQIYWEVMARTAPVAIVKNDKLRIFTPDVNQKADAYKVDQRLYHTLNINDNQMATVYCAKAASAGV